MPLDVAQNKHTKKANIMKIMLDGVPTVDPNKENINPNMLRSIPKIIRNNPLFWWARDETCIGTTIAKPNGITKLLRRTPQFGPRTALTTKCGEHGTQFMLNIDHANPIQKQLGNIVLKHVGITMDDGIVDIQYLSPRLFLIAAHNQTTMWRNRFLVWRVLVGKLCWHRNWQWLCCTFTIYDNIGATTLSQRFADIAQ